MKVISKPDYTNWVYEFTCHTCKSKLLADYTDLKYRTEKTWYSDSMGDGGYHGDSDYFYIVCPICNKDEQLHPNEKGINIHYLLQEKAKKEYKCK